MIPRDEFEIEQAKDLGKFFAQLRYKTGKTQRQFGEMIKGSQATVTNFETGTNDSRLSTLQIMARTNGYRLEIAVVPIAEGVDTRIVARPNPIDPTERKLGGTSRGKRGPRKDSRKLRAVPNVAEIEYEDEGEYDSAAEIARLRAKYLA